MRRACFISICVGIILGIVIDRRVLQRQTSDRALTSSKVDIGADQDPGITEKLLLILLHQRNANMKLNYSDCLTFQDPQTAVLLVAGQSNAGNFGGTPYLPNQNVYQMFEGYCFQARDPLVGAGGAKGSVWTRLADKLIENKQYKKVLIIPSAIEGSRVIQWSYAGEHHPLLDRALRIAILNHIKPTHFLWHQGEADAATGTTKLEYIAYFNNMIDRLRAIGLTAPAYVSVATRCSFRYEGQTKTGEPSREIQDAQKALVSPERLIFLGPNTDEIYDQGDRSDGCHFSNQGLEKFAKAWLSILSKK